MGVVVGAANHYGLSFFPKEYYCESGFAYALNIAPDLCPSGPYCWNHQHVLENLRHLGLSITYISLGDTTDPNNKVADEAARAHKEAVLSVEALEHQLVSDSDAKGIELSLPWGPDSEACLKRVEFDAMTKKDSPIFGFYRFDRCDSSEKLVRVSRGLDCALRMYGESADFQADGYRFGLSGFEVWADALRSNEFNSHGNWWNAQVWSECRHVAAEYFNNWELFECSETSSLAQKFSEVSSLLREAGDHELDNAKKRSLVLQAGDIESRAFDLLKDLAAKTRSEQAAS